MEGLTRREKKNFLNDSCNQVGMFGIYEGKDFHALIQFCYTVPNLKWKELQRLTNFFGL